LSPEFSDNVLPFWLEKHQSGRKMCLATLVEIDGSAPRPLGSQIAISEDGSAQGYITGGCAEAAIIAEAQAAISAGKNRKIRYGEGSPYKDIALPCGSGIDVYFDVNIKAEQVGQILERLRARNPIELGIDTKAQTTKISEPPSSKQDNKSIYTRRYDPNFRLYIAGKGPIVPVLATLADQSGFEVISASPEPETLARIMNGCGVKTHLNSPREFAPLPLDQWCAGVTLFHDHDWEPPILKHFLESPCFYVGALGSRATHSARLNALKTAGISDENLVRLRGPVGLDIQASTPTEIAISILAEIIQSYRTPEHGPARWSR